MYVLSPCIIAALNAGDFYSLHLRSCPFAWVPLFNNGPRYLTEEYPGVHTFYGDFAAELGFEKLSFS